MHHQIVPRDQTRQAPLPIRLALTEMRPVAGKRTLSGEPTTLRSEDAVRSLWWLLGLLLPLLLERGKKDEKGKKMEV